DAVEDVLVDRVDVHAPLRVRRRLAVERLAQRERERAVLDLLPAPVRDAFQCELPSHGGGRAAFASATTSTVTAFGSLLRSVTTRRAAGGSSSLGSAALPASFLPSARSAALSASSTLPFSRTSWMTSGR